MLINFKSERQSLFKTGIFIKLDEGKITSLNNWFHKQYRSAGISTKLFWNT